MVVVSGASDFWNQGGPLTPKLAKTRGKPRLLVVDVVQPRAGDLVPVDRAERGVEQVGVRAGQFWREVLGQFLESVREQNAGAALAILYERIAAVLGLGPALAG